MPYRELRPRNADSDNNLLTKITSSLAIGLGQYGADVYSSAGVHIGEWAVLHAVTAATVTFIRDGVSETLAIGAGDRVYGRITSVNATSGTVEAYRA